jgi:hypothetical protein
MCPVETSAFRGQRDPLSALPLGPVEGRVGGAHEAGHGLVSHLVAACHPDARAAVNDDLFMTDCCPSV